MTITSVLAALGDVPEPHANVASCAARVFPIERARVVCLVRAKRVNHDSIPKPAETQRLAVIRIERNLSDLSGHQFRERGGPTAPLSTVALHSQRRQGTTKLRLLE